jgi:hypothetical protein
MGKNIIITESQLKYLIGNNIKENKETLNEDKTIEAVQNALISKGYDVGSKGADGVLGPDTRKAVKKYQKDNGIPQTGFPGNITKGKLGITGTNQTNQTNRTNNTQTPERAKDSVMSSTISGDFKNLFSIDKLKATDSMYVCKAGQSSCGQFVNDFSEKLDFVGDAWLAHDLDGVGKRVWSVYTNLNEKFIDAISKTYNVIHKAGGWKDSGPMSETIKTINKGLTINQPSASILKVDDIVGIYYPPSSHHEEAFYEAGKNYFIKDKSGNLVKGKTLSGGKGFGMNTHVGIVGAIKDGVPLIFHNLTGSVYSDPYNKIKGGGKIAWVKRK